MKARTLAPKLVVAVVAVAAVSTAMLAAQGGFGGGDGRFDRVIGLLALPWVLIPWSESMWISDFVMLVLLPLGLNLLVVTVLWLGLARRR